MLARIVNFYSKPRASSEFGGVGWVELTVVVAGMAGAMSLYFGVIAPQITAMDREVTVSSAFQSAIGMAPQIAVIDSAGSLSAADPATRETELHKLSSYLRANSDGGESFCSVAFECAAGANCNTQLEAIDNQGEPCAAAVPVAELAAAAATRADPSGKRYAVVSYSPSLLASTNTLSHQVFGVSYRAMGGSYSGGGGNSGTQPPPTDPPSDPPESEEGDPPVSEEVFDDLVTQPGDGLEAAVPKPADCPDGSGPLGCLLPPDGDDDGDTFGPPGAPPGGGGGGVFGGG